MPEVRSFSLHVLIRVPVSTDGVIKTSSHPRKNERSSLSDVRCARRGAALRLVSLYTPIRDQHPMFIRSRRLLRAASATAFAITFSVLGATSAVADWTKLPLPPLAQSFATYRAAHTPAGLLVYASNNDLDVQTSFGAAELADSANVGTWWPSDVAVRGTVGAIGSGDFIGGTISLFDAVNLATAFTPIAWVNIQNYSLEFRDTAGLYVG